MAWLCEKFASTKRERNDNKNGIYLVILLRWFVQLSHYLFIFVYFFCQFFEVALKFQLLQ